MAIDDSCYRDTAHCSTVALETWVRADVAAHRDAPRSPTGTSRLDEPDGDPRPRAVDGTITQALYNARVEVVRYADQHGYERFAPQRPDAVRDDARGSRSLIVGTGGIGFYPWTGTAPNSVTEQTVTLAVAPQPAGRELREALPPGSVTCTDSGARTCH